MQNHGLLDKSQANDNLNIIYDQFCDLLGGLSLTDLPDHHKKKYADLLKKDTFLKFNQIFSQPNQYFFQNDCSGLFPVEVLYLKLNAYLQLVKETRSFSLKYKKTHLNIKPKNINIFLDESNGALPLKWKFNLKLAGESSLIPEKVDCQWAKKRLFNPATSPDKFYSSPSLLNTQFMSEKRIDSVISGVEEVEKKNGKYH